LLDFKSFIIFAANKRNELVKIGMYRKNKIGFLVALVLTYLWNTVALSQKVTIRGDIADAFLNTAIPRVVVSLHRADSTLIADSLRTGYYTNENGTLERYEFSTTFTPIAGQNTYLIHAYKAGYTDSWTPFTLTGKKSEVKIPTVKMRREQQIQLDEVTVKATKIKMYYRGDTIVYNADAFTLPDGSMLSSLIAQLPGVKMTESGTIYVNGRKVDELLLGSRSFFHDNRKVLMENLPYYTVNTLKVYEQNTDRNIALGHEVEPKKYVMDVNLKKEYQTGYIANIEGAAGTEDRWLGRGFLLSFTKHWRYSLKVNGNNVDENRHIGEVGYWSPDQIPMNRTTTQAIAGEADYELNNSKVRRLKNTLTGEYQHIKTTSETWQRDETFLEGLTPVSFSETSSKHRSYKLSLRENVMILQPLYATLSASFNRNRRKGYALSDFSQWNDTLTASSVTSSMDESTYTYGEVRVQTEKCVNSKRKQDVEIDMQVNYSDNRVERANRYDTWQYANAAVTHNTNDVKNSEHEESINGSFQHPFNANWKLRSTVSYLHRDTHDRDFLYHPDTLTLPSQLDFLTAITDPQNSYDYQYSIHEESFRLRLEHSVGMGSRSNDWKFERVIVITLQVPARQKRLHYQRGSIDTLAHQQTLYLNPKFDFIYEGKHNRIDVMAKFTTSDLNLTQNIAYRDDSQPLVVRLGNTGLKASQWSECNLVYKHTWDNNLRDLIVSTDLRYNHRNISTSVAYDASTGVYTYQPVNVGGEYSWWNSLKFSSFLDNKEYWNVENNTSVILHHSVDHTMLSGASRSVLNKVNTVYLEEEGYIKFANKWLDVRLNGNVKWRHSEGHMRDFSTLNTIDYQYGISGRYTLPVLKVTLSVDATMYSRRGYGSSSLNTDDFVLNASLSRSIIKNKLVARIEAYDLLHQLSNTRYEVNAQGRTETVYRSLPHYIMLHMIYHWNRNPKRK
jgi:hypothetical protein